MSSRIQSAGRWRDRGVTLVEMVVVIGIIGVLAAAGVALFGQDRPAKFDDDVQGTMAALRQMQSDARTAKDNKEYGVCFSSTGWTSFSLDPASSADPCAAGYAGKILTQAFKRASLSSAITPPDSKVTFERVTGKPKGGAVAVLTFSMSSPSRTKVIRVEATGVQYVQ